MTRTENLKLVISGDGKLLGAELGKSEQRVRTYGNRVTGIFRGINSHIGSGIKSIATNPLTMFGGMAGVLYAGKKLIDYQDAISTVGINANLSGQQIMSLDKSIYDLAYNAGQSRDGVVKALSDIYDKTGDFDFASKSLRTVARASTGMSADIMDSARVLSAMRIGMNVTAEDAEQLFDIMARMGNIGSMTFAQQAAQAERLFSSSTLALGITKKNFAEYNAFVQSAKPMFGSVDQTGTAIERIMMDLVTQRKTIGKTVGFKLFDEKGAIIDFKKTMVALSKLSVEKRSKIFGEFGRAFLGLSKGGGIENYEKMISDGERLGFIQDAFSKKSSEAKFQINALTTAANQFADSALSPIIKELTSSLTELTSNPERMQEFMQNIRDIGEIFGHIAKAIGFAIDKYLWFYNFNKKANLGHFAYQMTHPSEVMKNSQSDVDKFNALSPEERRKKFTWLHKDDVAGFNTLPSDKRKEIFDRLNKEGNVSLKEYMKPNVVVSQPINITVKNTGLGKNISTEVESDNPNAPITANRGNFD